MTLGNLLGMGGGVGVECLPVDTEVLGSLCCFFIFQSGHRRIPQKVWNIKFIFDVRILT